MLIPVLAAPAVGIVVAFEVGGLPGRSSSSSPGGDAQAIATAESQPSADPGAPSPMAAGPPAPADSNPAATATPPPDASPPTRPATSAVAAAVDVSRLLFPDGGVTDVVLARDLPFGDALVAGGPVGALNTTVLLTDQVRLSPQTAEEIDRLGRPTVHILGGVEAVSAEVERQLAQAGRVHRYAGSTQAETAVSVTELRFPTSDTAVLVPGASTGAEATEALADALAASGFAAANAVPVLLTGRDALPSSTDAYLARSAVRRVVVIGDETRVGAAVTDRLTALGVGWTRWAGEDRYATAVTVAREAGFAASSDAGTVLLVAGEPATAWPDGFLGALQAGHVDAPVLLASGDDLPPPTLEYLRAGAAGAGGAPTVTCTLGVTEAACRAAAAALGDGP